MDLVWLSGGALLRTRRSEAGRLAITRVLCPTLPCDASPDRFSAAASAARLLEQQEVRATGCARAPQAKAAPAKPDGWGNFCSSCGGGQKGGHTVVCCEKEGCSSVYHFVCLRREAKARWKAVKGTEEPWLCEPCFALTQLGEEVEQLKAQIAAAGIGQDVDLLISNASTAALETLRKLDGRGAGDGATTTTMVEGETTTEQEQEDTASVSAALAGLLDSYVAQLRVHAELREEQLRNAQLGRELRRFRMATLYDAESMGRTILVPHNSLEIYDF